jgi:hypothetical protein
MATVGNARRPIGLAVAVLLASVLTALGVSVAAHDAESRSSGAAVDNSLATPARAMGRLAVEPSPVSVHGHGELVLFGAVPDGAPATVLPLLSGYGTAATPTPPVAHRPAVGDRAPPLRLSDL